MNSSLYMLKLGGLN